MSAKVVDIYLAASWHASSETQGQIVGPKTKIKTGGKKFDEQKYERKIRAPGDKLFTHQFQTAKQILTPEVFCPIRSEYSFGCLELVRKEFVPRDSYFSFVLCSSNFFPPVLIFIFGPTICPWVSEDARRGKYPPLFTSTLVNNNNYYTPNHYC